MQKQAECRGAPRLGSTPLCVQGLPAMFPTDSPPETLDRASLRRSAGSYTLMSQLHRWTRGPAQGRSGLSRSTEPNKSL